MTKPIYKKLQKKRLFIIFSFIAFLAIVGLLIFFYLPTANWYVYKSNKVPLSFKYPKDWPISQCSHPYLFSQMKIEEMISFKNECDWGNYGNSIGNITIEQLNEDTDPKTMTNSSGFADGYNRSLESIKIGNKNGYFLVVKPDINNPPSRPISKEKNYYVVANNLVYRIRILEDTFYKGNEEVTKKTLEKMFSTFQF